MDTFFILWDYTLKWQVIRIILRRRDSCRGGRLRLWNILLLRLLIAALRL